MRYGRMYENVVVAVTELPVGHSIEQHVGATQAENYQEIPDEVGVGFYQKLDGLWLTPEQYQEKKLKGINHVKNSP